MIHSLSGGILKNEDYADFVKVEIIDKNFGEGFYWYKNEISDIKINDIVIVPVGQLNNLVKAKVVRIDKNVSSYNSPIPFKRAKYIYSKSMQV